MLEGATSREKKEKRAEEQDAKREESRSDSVMEDVS
ncbi:hypothetical protein Ptr902_11400 [Pyrenophora tritici-repentis]|nr:hypothetical protein Ptr902_11400 [Pyrenophora tritici-repentis]